MKRVACASACGFPSAFARLGIIAILAALTLTAPCVGAAEDEQQKGIALIARAQLLEKLLAPDTGPFRLHAHVKLFGLVEGTREGDYFLLAASPGQWFEQTRFPGYSELSGLSDGQRWRKRNVIEKPFRFHEVAQLLSPAYHLELPAEARVTKFSQKEVRGAKAFCIEASPTAELWQKERAGKAAISPVGFTKESQATLCFDASTGLLLSATYQADLPHFEYEGQVTLGNKVFPKVLRCYEGKDLAVEATIEELTKEEAQDPAGFLPPAGAEKWPYCANPEPPQLIEKKQLKEDVLMHAKAQRKYGTVYCLAEVGVDGSVHDLAWLQGGFGVLAGAVKETVAAWRYKPALCNGTPVPVTIYLAYTIPP
jgi:Gram-negative bacterial TonB protein C-terminal